MAEASEIKIKEERTMEEEQKPRESSDAEKEKAILETEQKREPAPEGWMTKHSLTKLLGETDSKIKATAKQYSEAHPEWFNDDYLDRGGREREHYSPELVELIKGELAKHEKAPEGWMTNSALTKLLGEAEGTVKAAAGRYKETHPEWFSDDYLDKGGHEREHYSPELVEEITKEFAKREKAPEGWMTNHALAMLLGETDQKVELAVSEYRETYPEWFNDDYLDRGGREREHYSPELVELIKGELAKHEKAPEGWMTNYALRELLGIGRTEGKVKSIADNYRETHPEWFNDDYLDRGGREREHYSPELVELIKGELAKHEKAPEGWMTNYALRELLGIGRKVKSIADNYRETHPEWFNDDYLDRGGREREHYSPELVEEITRIIQEQEQEREGTYERKEQEVELKKGLEEFVSEVAEGNTLEAQEFRNLVSLFGSANAIDILYKYRPEFKGVQVEYVKGMLADYLGNFLITKAPFTLENIEPNIEYLSETNLKEGLYEIIKEDCLSFYNKAKRRELDESDEQIIRRYFEGIREGILQYGSEDLNEVVERAESYYRSLFEDFPKPENIVDSLGEGREFPDINQRINLKEIADKKKMLIADRMGGGKSASALLAKEYLGLRRALVVVPSNVTKTWERYLSDQIDEEGNQVGYFKEGFAPKVFVAENLKSLREIDSSDYDYIIISQEKLYDRYVQELEKIDYDMLIVDEIHKLKNVKKGRRAEDIVSLAEKIKGEDSYLAMLSGTPVPNKVEDLAITLKLLYPERFSGVSNKKFVRDIVHGDIIELRNLLVPRMQMKDIVESADVPQLSEQIVDVELSPLEREIYDALLEEGEDELTTSQKMQILRQFLLNPELVDSTPNLDSAKIGKVGEELRRTFAEKDKVVMFVNGYIEGVMRGEKTIFDNLALPPDVEVRTIEGEVSAQDREEIQKELKKSDKKLLLVVSGETADVGVDFSGAQEVFFYNEPWTKYNLQQQTARVYRPGLENDLTSRIFVTGNSIEGGIHNYIDAKYQAIEKLLQGVPITDLERELLEKDEMQADINLEVSPELAEYYFSSWDKMMKIFGYVKDIGEKDFVRFLEKYGREYADCYADLGSRSYQANATRVSGTLINAFVKEKGQDVQDLRIIDIASGPEMLRNHIGDDYENVVMSMDINQYHFREPGGERVVGSFLDLPFREKSMDYANLSLALHYANFAPDKEKFERLEVLGELNRVLKDGGRVVVNLLYSLDLKDEEKFKTIIDGLGFEIVDEYSGKVAVSRNYRSRTITLEKIKDCPGNLEGIIRAVGKENFDGLRFVKTKERLGESRKMITDFSLGEKTFSIDFNEQDREVLREEQGILEQGENLKARYGAIRDIPRQEVINNRFIRIFNGKRYILFKKLEKGAGVVVIRS